MGRLAGRPPEDGGSEGGRAEGPGAELRGRAGVEDGSQALGNVVSQAGRKETC